jgi:ABC-type sugar transport system ATPase subunit
VLEIRALSKTFAGTRALAGVDLDIRPGEVHALVGQNGSGKSTLIKVLAGYHHADAGSLAALDGERLDLSVATAGRHPRMRFVHQDLGLIEDMSAMENLALRDGFSRGRGRRIDWRAQQVATRELLRVFDTDLDVRRPLREASMIDRTIVAIAFALAGWQGGRGVLVLDEPTAMLPHTEVKHLLDIVRGLKASGTSVLYVSHRLDEIFQMSDRVTVLRDGRLIATRDTTGLDKQTLAELMVGTGVEANYRARQPQQRDPAVVLQARNVRGRYLRGVDLQLHAGEVVGLAGLPGSGAEELPYVLAGARTADVSGELRLPRLAVRWVSLAAVERPQIPIVPADRSREGIVAQFSVAENISLSVLHRLSHLGSLRRRREAELVRTWFSRIRVKAASTDAPITSLSGGNQQKVVIARCLAREPELLILCEPTSGVDVGTRQAIYDLIAERAAAGLAVLVSSTDAGDLVAMCHRVTVLQRGVAVTELAGSEITEQNVLWNIESEKVS